MNQQQIEYLKKFKVFYEGSSGIRSQYIADDNFIYDGIKYLTSDEFKSIAAEVVSQRPELLDDPRFIEALKEEAFRRVYPILYVQPKRQNIK